MKFSNNLSCTFLKHFTNVLPISLHPSFTPSLENSDKLILPESIFFTIRKYHYPLPPAFVLRSHKFSLTYTICGVFEFSAEEGCLYCPTWILKKISKRSKYTSNEAYLEILINKKKNSLPFPLLKKIEVCSNSEINAELCKSGLMMYTVVNRGEDLKVFDKEGNSIEVHVVNLLPKNRCLVKSNNFVVNVVQKVVFTNETEEDEGEGTPMIECLPISLLAKSRVIEKRKCESYTPWEHRIQPIKIEGETIDLLPWEREEVVQKEVTTQTLPEISTTLKKSPKPVQFRQRKILTLAFPQLNVPDKRPLTTLEIDVKYKSISNSPIALRANYHKNSVY